MVSTNIDIDCAAGSHFCRSSLRAKSAESGGSWCSYYWNLACEGSWKLHVRGKFNGIYKYPGQELPQLQQNVLNIFTPAYQPADVIIQCGGNDAANRPTHKVVLEYDRLVNNVRKACPKSIITLGIIPPRGTDRTILENIAKVNTYITNRGNRGDGVVSSDLCPCDYQHYKTDLIHFNQTGTQIFACRLATHIASFRACPQ